LRCLGAGPRHSPTRQRPYQAPTCLQDHHAEQCHHREPGDAGPAQRHHHEGRQQRPDRAAEVAADLKQRLRRAMRPPEARRATRDASGWKTAEPMPISIAPASSQP
jgi:hypothetical protein